MDPLLLAFARRLGVSPEAARPALDALLRGLRDALDRDGAAPLAGVGSLHTHDGALHFRADPALLAAVNRVYAGLAPIGETPPAMPAPAGREDASGSASVSSADGGVGPEPALIRPVPVSAADVAEAPPPDEPDAEPDGRALTVAAVGLAALGLAAHLATPSGTYEAEPDEASGPPADPLADPLADPPVPIVGPLAWLDEEPPLRDLASEPAPESDDATLDADLDTLLTVPLPPEPSGFTSRDPDGEKTSEANPAPEAPSAEAADDWEATLAGVWAPADPPNPEHPLGPGGLPIEDAEFSVVNEVGPGTLPTAVPSTSPFAHEEPPVPDELPSAAEATSPAETAAIPLSVPPPAYRRPAPAAPTPSGPRRGSGLVFGLVAMALLAALVVALVALWPRLRSAGSAPEVEPEVAANGVAGETETPPDEPSAPAVDSASPGAAGEPAPADDATEAETPAAPPPSAAAPSTAAPSGPPPDARPEPEPVETPAAEPPAPPARRPEPPAAEPAPSYGLRGSDPIDPAAGGATWVLASTTAAEAERHVARLRRQGFRACVLRAIVGGRTVHRVAVGQFATVAGAQRVRGALPEATRADAWILRLDAR